MRIVALAGGVGAARFLQGLVRVVDPAALTVVANTGDDITLHGLHVSPDLDSITYTLGGGVDQQRGWGRAFDSSVVTAELRERYDRPSWFRLGDKDLATHLVRTEILANRGTLSDATKEIATAWRLPFELLPMTDDAVATRIVTTDGRDLHFQQWWVGERGEPDVAEVRLAGADVSRPAPGVLEAIARADAVVVCPSNPVVSIGTILAVPGIREALRGATVVGVSPIVGGGVLRGMAHRLLPATGSAVSADAVAERYADFLAAWVMDVADRDLEPQVRALGVRTCITDAVMRDVDVATELARTTISLVS